MVDLAFCVLKDFTKIFEYLLELLKVLSKIALLKVFSN